MRIFAKSLGLAALAGALTFSVAAVQAESFSPFGDSGSGYGSGAGRGDFTGDGSGEGEAEFDMKFKGRGKSRGNFQGSGDSDWRGSAYGYETPPYWGWGGPYGGAPYGGAPYGAPPQPGWGGMGGYQQPPAPPGYYPQMPPRGQMPQAPAAQ